MFKNKLILSIGTVAIGSSLLIGTKTHAVDEDWNTPVFTYGKSLTDKEMEFTKQALGITNEQGKDMIPNYKDMEINGSDLMKYLPNMPFTEDSGVWSSTLIVPLKKDSGVSVQVKTPQNITYYTDSQYRNAVIDSGITDAEVRVGSAVQVDGSGAMTGIYKAFDTGNPAKDSTEEKERAEQREVAQEMLDATGKVTAENNGKDGYSDDKLNSALAETKAEISKIASKQDELATKEDIQKMLEDALKNQGIDGTVTNNQINNILVPSLEDFSKTPLAKENTTASAYNKLSEQINDGVNDLGKYSLDDIGISSGLSGFFEGFKNFFTGNGWKTNYEKAQDKSKDAVQELQKGSSDTVDSIKDGATDSINKAKEKSKGFWQKIVDFFKGVTGEDTVDSSPSSEDSNEAEQVSTNVKEGTVTSTDDSKDEVNSEDSNSNKESKSIIESTDSNETVNGTDSSSN